jgi:tetratricopeptide (TPR) repeat protein
MYKDAGPIYEQALAVLPADGAPFPSARIARRIARDQAGMSYGISGQYVKARAIFETGVAEDPDYPMYYYNLACADAGENKLPDAQAHLEQAFVRKSNVNQGETMPDPTKDDSFLPYKGNKAFWAALEHLENGK